MKFTLPTLLTFLLVLYFAPLFSQVVYVTDWESDADKKVYVTEWKSEADLKIFFTDWKSDADIVIYYTEWPSEAGWRTDKR